MVKIWKYVIGSLSIIIGNGMHYSIMPLLYYDVHPYFFMVGSIITFFIIMSPLYFIIEYFGYYKYPPNLKDYYKEILIISLCKTLYSILFFNNIILYKTPICIIIILFSYPIIYSIPLRKLILNKIFTKFNICHIESILSLSLSTIGILCIIIPLLYDLLHNDNIINGNYIILSIGISILANINYVLYNILQEKYLKNRKQTLWRMYNFNQNIMYDIFYIIYWTTLFEICMLILVIWVTCIPYFGDMKSVYDIIHEINQNILCISHINLDNCHDKYSFIYSIIYIIGYILSYIGHININKYSTNLSMYINTLSIPFIVFLIKILPINYLGNIHNVEYWVILISFLICLLSILLWKYGEIKSNNIKYNNLNSNYSIMTDV